MKNEIIVIGGGGHAKVVINTLKKTSSYNILGYTDIIDKGPVLYVNYLGTDDILPQIFSDHKGCGAVIAIGGVQISNKRHIIYNKLKKIGFQLPVLLSNKAVIGEDVTIAEGTVILEEAVVNPGCIIGKCVIINNGAILDYDCIVEDFVHLTPKTLVSNSVKIGANSFVGSGSIITQGVEVLNDCLVAAGAVLNSSTLVSGNYLGFPAVLK